ncbi:hypothetical protein TWF481_008074 [Arthrobotrys musiformis]|uniref:ribonuclease H n=1 Tax=Arthrobotrys musiformis TaxID=47236 RepID=A0AAV9W7Z8_9PEZI
MAGGARLVPATPVRPMQTIEVNHIAHARACHSIACSAQPSSDTVPDVEKFIPNPADAAPEDLFPPGTANGSYQTPHQRFRSLGSPKHILIYTDGACSNNGKEDAAAGCAFYYRPAGTKASGERTTGVVSFRLENHGPNGLPGLQTSNRAELRAVIAALQYRVWHYRRGKPGEARKRIVIATDSEYVVLGITTWIKNWQENGWLNSNGRLVANRDLWDELLKVIGRLGRHGTKVQFWRIPRRLNTVADKAAKAATALPPVAKYATIR